MRHSAGVGARIWHRGADSRGARSSLLRSPRKNKDCLGSEYLGKHPPIPAGKITLDLNYDDVKPLGAPEEVEVSGAERTTFYPAVEATAKEFRLAIRPDARPEAGHFYRSDHFSLARVGIPSFSINEGMKYKGHSRSLGSRARARVRREALSPAERRIPSGDGFRRRLGDGAVRIRAGMGGRKFAEVDWMAEGRRVRGGADEEPAVSCVCKTPYPLKP